jgi:hypothetical protein
LLHVPKGILSELKLFDNRGHEPNLILCQRFSFVDPDEAVQAIAAECYAYIDSWIERDSARSSSYQRQAPGLGQASTRLNSTTHTHGLASQLRAPSMDSQSSRHAEGYQSR